MLYAVRTACVAGQAGDHDSTAGSAGRWPAGEFALAETSLVLPHLGLSARVVHRAGRAGPGPIQADQPAEAGRRVAVADAGRTIVQAARDHDLSWPVVANAFTTHANAVLPAEPEPVTVLGIDELRRGKPHWIWDAQAGSSTTSRGPLARRLLRSVQRTGSARPGRRPYHRGGHWLTARASAHQPSVSRFRR